MNRAFPCVCVLILSIVGASFAVSVTVSSPMSGSTVGSPVTFKAYASSGYPITGWRIYVDNTSVYQAGTTSSISASVAMSTGTHQVIVRAWDSTDASSSSNLTVAVSSSSGVSVSVSSPANYATVSSPATINAYASSGYAISGWHIYVDGNSVYSAGSTGSISAPVSMSSGTHQVIVRAWNSTGAYGSTSLTLNVSGGTSGGGPTPPSYAIKYANLEQTTNWGKCSSASCSGGTVAWSFYNAPYQSSPSLDGASTMFYIYGGSYADALWWIKPGNNASPTHAIFEFSVYADSNSYNYAEALEFDFIQVSGGRKYNFSTQCNYGTGTWDTWNESTQHWVHSNVHCVKFSPNTWHQVKWAVERVGYQTHYLSITIDGVTYPISSTYAYQPAPATSWTNGALIFQVQQDLNSKGGSFKEWVDKANIYLW